MILRYVIAALHCDVMLS